MLERRKETRRRVILGGAIAFNKRCSVLTCRVRNMSASGALVSFESAAIVPAEFDFSVARESAVRARLVWRTPEAAGIRFQTLQESNVIPLDYAVRLKACERENESLRRRVADLGGEV